MQPALPSSARRGEPDWRPVARFTTRQLPQLTRRWLLDDGSLTARLLERYDGDLQVRRRFQGWCRPRPSECRLLDVSRRQLALVREVELVGAGHPVVFARSVFPLETLQGSLGHLRWLQNRSLGSILFSNPRVQRSEFELAVICGDHDYIPADLAQQQPAWGRRSRFTLQDHPLLVSEVFLHSFSPWPTAAPVHRSQRGRVRRGGESTR